MAILLQLNAENSGCRKKVGILEDFFHHKINSLQVKARNSVTTELVLDPDSFKFSQLKYG